MPSIMVRRIIIRNSPEKRRVSLLDRMKPYKQSYILMAPYFILFTLFTVLPVIASIGLSFTNFNILEPPVFTGWDNYVRLFLEDDIFVTGIKNTLLFAVITGPLSYIACFLFAWIINEFGSKLRAFLTLIFYAPSISGNVYFIWRVIFSGDRYGFFNGLLLNLGILNEPVIWLRKAE